MEIPQDQLDVLYRACRDELRDYALNYKEETGNDIPVEYLNNCLQTAYSATLNDAEFYEILSEDPDMKLWPPDWFREFIYAHCKIGDDYPTE